MAPQKTDEYLNEPRGRTAESEGHIVDCPDQYSSESWSRETGLSKGRFETPSETAIRGFAYRDESLNLFLSIDIYFSIFILIIICYYCYLLLSIHKYFIYYFLLKIIIIPCCLFISIFKYFFGFISNFKDHKIHGMLIEVLILFVYISREIHVNNILFICPSKSKILYDLLNPQIKWKAMNHWSNESPKQWTTESTNHWSNEPLKQWRESQKIPHRLSRIRSHSRWSERCQRFSEEIFDSVEKFDIRKVGWGNKADVER